MRVTLALRSASLVASIPDGVKLFAGEWIISYLKLFPEAEREAVYGQLGDRPTLDSVIDRLGGFPGILELDECINIRVHGKVCYITEQRDLDEYVPFGFYRVYRQLEFQTAHLRVAGPDVHMDQLPEGYAYLRGVTPTAVPAMATVFGANPPQVRLLPYVSTGKMAPFRVGLQPLSPPPSPEVKKTAVIPQLPQDKECSATLGICDPTGLCEACQSTATYVTECTVPSLPCVPSTGSHVDDDMLYERVGVLNAHAEVAADVVLLPEDASDDVAVLDSLNDGQMWCVGHPGHDRDPELADIVSYLRVHRCSSLHADLVSIDCPLWAFEIQMGETVSCGRFRFTPQGPEGGVVVGAGYAVLLYEGMRDRLVMRRFSHHAYTRFLHLRLGYGTVSRLKQVETRAASGLLYKPAFVRVDSGTGHEVFLEKNGKPVKHRDKTGRSEIVVLPLGHWGTVVQLSHCRAIIARGSLVLSPSVTMLCVGRVGARSWVDLYVETVGPDPGQCQYSVVDDVDLVNVQSLG